MSWLVNSLVVVLLLILRLTTRSEVRIEELLELSVVSDNSEHTSSPSITSFGLLSSHIFNLNCMFSLNLWSLLICFGNSSETTGSCFGREKFSSSSSIFCCSRSFTCSSFASKKRVQIWIFIDYCNTYARTSKMSRLTK
jgi:hypothetical protein